MGKIAKLLHKIVKAKATPFFVLAIFGMLTVLTVGLAQQQQELRQQAETRNPQMISSDDIDNYFQCLSLGGTCSDQVANTLRQVDPAECVTLAGPTDPEALIPEPGPITFRPQTVNPGELLSATGKFIIDKERPGCADATHAELPSYMILAIHDETGERILFPTKTVPFTLIADNTLPGETSNVLPFLRFPPLAYADAVDLNLTITITDELPEGNYTACLRPASDDPLESLNCDDEIADGAFSVANACLENLQVSLTLNGQASDITVQRTGGDNVTIAASFQGECANPLSEQISFIGSNPNGEIVTYGVQGDVSIPGSTATINVPIQADTPLGKWKVGVSIGDQEIFNASSVLSFTVVTAGSDQQPNYGTKNVGEACTQTPDDYQGGCKSGLICNTWFDTTCTGGNCAGVCLEFEDQVCWNESASTFGEPGAQGSVCKEIDTDYVQSRLGESCETGNDVGNGFYGTCYQETTTQEATDDTFTPYSLICYTAKDGSTGCKNSGLCKGHCRAAYPGKLPGNPCDRNLGWQGGCINGQYCAADNTCKPGGQEAAEQAGLLQANGTGQSTGTGGGSDDGGGAGGNGNSAGGGIASDNGCTDRGGTCEDTGTSSHRDGEGGSFESNLCTGSSTRKCWIPGGDTASAKGQACARSSDCRDGLDCVGEICRQCGYVGANFICDPLTNYPVCTDNPECVTACTDTCKNSVNPLACASGKRCADSGCFIPTTSRVGGCTIY
ncbi:MAG: hypothetical protein AAB553_04765 [Patescibacteria group bacterium]